MSAKKMYHTGNLVEKGLADFISGNYSEAKSIFEEMSGDEDCTKPAFLLREAYVMVATAAEIAVSSETELEQAYECMIKASNYASMLGEKVAIAREEGVEYRAMDGFWITQKRVDELCETWKDIRDKHFHEDVRLSSLL